MSEHTPDRLKAFREQYRPRQSKAGWILGLVQLAALGLGFAAVLYVQLYRGAPAPISKSGGLPAETQRRLALYLAEKNDWAAAIDAYNAYLQTAELSLPERANILFAMAKLAIDNEQYERALPYLYQAEFLNPQSDVKGEIDKKIVLCLDKLGRRVDLRHELRERARIARKAEDVPPGETILAEFSGEVITDRDLEEEIEKLPASIRDSFAGPDKKLDLLKNMVAQRMLLDKARRLELDKTPEIQEQLLKALDGLVVQKLIADEVRAAVQITPEDVERYYKAEIGRFTEPATAEVLVGKADTEEAAKALTEFKEKPVVAAKGMPVPGTPESLDASDLILGTEPGAIAGPVHGEDGWYVFKVVSKKPEKVLPFEEVKERAAQMLQAQKEQEKFQALIDQTVQSQDVKLFPERLKGK